MVSISGISGSVTILKIFYLNLEQPIIVGYQFSYYLIRFWEIRKFLTNGLRESPCSRYTHLKNIYFYHIVIFNRKIIPTPPPFLRNKINSVLHQIRTVKSIEASLHTLNIIYHSDGIVQPNKSCLFK
jgi:hypothetical protein